MTTAVTVDRTRVETEAVITDKRHQPRLETEEQGKQLQQDRQRRYHPYLQHLLHLYPNWYTQFHPRQHGRIRHPFEGEALMWYDTVEDSFSRREDQTFGNLSRLLRDRYMVKRSNPEVVARLRHRRQQRGESLVEYAQKLREIASSNPVDEEWLVDSFLSGMSNTWCATLVRGHRPATLNEAVNSAVDQQLDLHLGMMLKDGWYCHQRRLEEANSRKKYPLEGDKNDEGRGAAIDLTKVTGSWRLCTEDADTKSTGENDPESATVSDAKVCEEQEAPEAISTVEQAESSVTDRDSSSEDAYLAAEEKVDSGGTLDEEEKTEGLHGEAKYERYDGQQEMLQQQKVANGPKETLRMKYWRRQQESQAAKVEGSRTVKSYVFKLSGQRGKVLTGLQDGDIQCGEPSSVKIWKKTSNRRTTVQDREAESSTGTDCGSVTDGPGERRQWKELGTHLNIPPPVDFMEGFSGVAYAQSMTVDALIVDRDTEDFLIGEDWMYDQGVKIDFVSSEMKWYEDNTKKVVPFTGVGAREQRERVAKIRLMRKTKAK
eukprot:jgi/Phyca11/16746/fgenesh1_pg.PHYCAscaffold_22_\